MQNTEFRTGVIRPIECVKEGFELIKDDYWLLFAISLVGAIIGGVTLYILLGAMCCGMFLAYLKKIDGQRVAFDDLFKGLNYFGPGLVVTIFIVVPIIIVYGLIYIPFVIAMIMGPNLSEGELFALLAGAFAVDFVFVIIMVCFHTLLMFAFPLIVDRGMGGIAAIKTSARAVMKNLGGVAGLVGVNMVLMIVGQLALCIGIYFVIPIMFAGNVVAYRRVFPTLIDRAGHEPPPPNFYQGL